VYTLDTPLLLGGAALMQPDHGYLFDCNKTTETFVWRRSYYFLAAIFDFDKSAFTQSTIPRNPALVFSTVCAVVCRRHRHTGRTATVSVLA
jgi:hypothetical protein